MRFAVYGGFEIIRKDNKHGTFDKQFWEKVEQQSVPDLRNACGCYIFCMQFGNNIRPWYVGKTEKGTFHKKCFQATKINYYNEVLIDHNGKPLLFLIPRLTLKHGKFSKPGTHPDVGFLETMLIGYALEQNHGLLNIKKTKFLREIVVPGIINTPPAHPTQAQHDLKIVLGLQ